MNNIAHKSYGITSGLGITTYFASLFESNELLNPSQRMSDQQIAKKVANEFPDRQSAQDFSSMHPKKTVNSYRYRYNKGQFTRNLPPKVLSIRYNIRGLPVNGKTGTIRLLDDDVTHKRREHTTYRHKVMESLI